MKSHLFGCTGKKKFSTRELALEVNARVRARKLAKELHPYQCEHCGCWHLSGQTPEEHQRRLEKMYANRRRYAEGRTR